MRLKKNSGIGSGDRHGGNHGSGLRQFILRQGFSGT